MSPYLQKEMINFQRTNARIFTPSTSQKPSTTFFFTSAVDPIITTELMEKKVIKDSFYERNGSLNRKYKNKVHAWFIGLSYENHDKVNM